MLDQVSLNAKYWDALARAYQQQTRIATDDFHFGPLLPGDRDLEIIPAMPPGARCLEIGCGAGQNSLYLAARGYTCTAIDVSLAQLEHGRRLAADLDLTVDFQHIAIEELASVELGLFDLVHSTYAMPFASDPAEFIEQAARHLKPGGHLVLTTAHPVFAGDWLQDEDGMWGLFLGNYFDPPADIRHLDDALAEEELMREVSPDDETLADVDAHLPPQATRSPDATADARDDALSPDGLYIASRAYPIGVMIDWLHESGLRVDRLIEPMPMPIPAMNEEDIQLRVPYDSPAWRGMYEQLAAMPVVAIFVAVKQA